MMDCPVCKKPLDELMGGRVLRFAGGALVWSIPCYRRVLASLAYDTLTPPIAVACVACGTVMLPPAMIGGD
jgi:hypothetical protein